MTDQTSKAARFYVLEADDASLVLQDVADGQVHALGENPGLEAGAVIEATIESVPPAGATWELVELAGEREIDVRAEPGDPHEDAAEAAPDVDGELVELAVEGDTVHVISVPDTEAAVPDVVEDEATVTRAARLGADTVEVRAGDGFIAVRYR